VAFGPQPPDDGGLAVRKRPGDDLLDAHCGGHGPCGRLVVAGQQDRSQPEGAELGDGRGGRRLDLVGDGDGPAHGAIPAD
jgi:hypothetical protein